MALKKPFEPLSLFSMSSMTDVIFLLLIFFMVTSSLFTPSALEVDLASSQNQVDRLPVTEVYIDSLYNLYIVEDRTDSVNIEKSYPREVDINGLSQKLGAIKTEDADRRIAIYVDKSVEFEKIAEVMNVAANHGLKKITLPTRVPADAR